MEQTSPYSCKSILFYTILGFFLMATYGWVQDLILLGFEQLPYILPSQLFDKWEPILSQYAFQDTVHCIIFTILCCTYLYIRSRKIGKDSQFKIIYLRKPDSKDILSGLIVFLAGGSVSFLWIVLVDALRQYIPFLQASFDAFAEKGSLFVDNNWYIFTLLSVAIIGPIVEELLVRGLIFGEMHRKMPIALAIVLNGLIFGVFHVNFVQVVYTAILGMAYAYVYYYTESFWLVCGMHILNNFKETLPPMNEAIDDGLTIGFLILGYVCIIPAIIAMRYLYKKSKKRGMEDGIYGN